MKKVPILFTGLPFIFNESLRKGAGIKDGEVHLEKILCERSGSYEILPEWSALSSCYFDAILRGPSFSILKENFMKR
mgnify:CR=1 FL=1